MSCEQAHLDAAYVLGALPPTERQSYERHLAGCPACSAAVRELAGLPGLLARLDADEVAGLGGEVEPPPPGLLPTLAEAARGRRTRRLRAAGAALVAAAVLVVATLLLAGGLGGGDGSRATTPPSAAAYEPMTQVGQYRLTADISLQRVAWGTKVRLRCAYAGSATAVRGLPPYSLVVRTTDGRVEQVATWRAVAGRVATIDAATSAGTGDIATLEVRTAGGTPLLTLQR